jgi:Soluble lytic murein transglycosylase and related regulatory proteins (some contain LysM/invasin domains)
MRHHKNEVSLEQKDLVKAAHILKAKGHSASYDLVKVLTCLANQAETQVERELTVELAHHLSPASVVWIARKAGNQEPILLKMAYPVCNIHHKTRVSEKELLFSMAHKESDFNPKAVSPKGAKGLLQLMSATAKLVAKKLKIPHRDEKLFDPSHNLLLASTHVSMLLEKHNGSYALVTAAYNAGDTPVERWIETFGHPKNMDIITWIECIPYSETRNHVQRVLENVTNYRSREGTPRRTLIDDLKE